MIDKPITTILINVGIHLFAMLATIGLYFAG
jgi:hypothetical protein